MADITDHDNAMKWVASFLKLPFWLRVCIIGVIVVAVCAWVYTQFKIVPDLQLRIDQLTSKLDDARSEISKLTVQNSLLHTENQSLKVIMAPIQRKAEQLYPEMETAAALAKLAKQFDTVKKLATRDEYKPLEEQGKRELIEALRILHSKYSTLSPSVTINFQQGSQARSKVADDLKKYLKESGFSAEVSPMMDLPPSTPQDVYVEYKPEDIQFAHMVIGTIATMFINKDFKPINNNTLAKGHFEIRIYGDPVFSEEGIVTFK